jgi:hypothetical protein
MTYLEFKSAIETTLRRKHAGATWKELRIAARLPYDRPCPEWMRNLEREIGLVRRKDTGRELIWCLREKAKRNR